MTEIKTTNKPTISANTGNAVSNAKKVHFNTLIKSDAVQSALNKTLGDVAKTKTFTTSLISAVNSNPQLQDCDGTSIISAALVGECLNLSPSPQLGQYYIVPYKDKKTGVSKATFQLGWKGYYALAIRSGQYKKLDVVPVKQGELKAYHEITGDIEIEEITDPLKREEAPTIGYYAYFELMNGFKKSMYWSRERMVDHAKRYSRTYERSDSLWQKDFDAMAIKTMYRQLIGKYGIMSVDMQTAYSSDMAVQPDITKSENSGPEYIDAVVDSETGEVTE